MITYKQIEKLNNLEAQLGLIVQALAEVAEDFNSLKEEYEQENEIEV